MKQEEWTPAPWEVGSFRKGFAKDVQSKCGPVCYGDIRLSDAHLIAAAPDLFEVLDAILSAGQWYESALEIDMYRGVDALSGAELKAMAEKALAKARGESSNPPD